MTTRGTPEDRAAALLARVKREREEAVRQELRERIATGLEEEALRAPISREIYIKGLATRIREGDLG